MKKLELDRKAFAGATVLSRAELKTITGGESENIPNTWACDCGPGTSMAIYAESVEDVIPNYLSYVSENCTSEIRCVPW